MTSPQFAAAMALALLLAGQAMALPARCDGPADLCTRSASGSLAIIRDGKVAAVRTDAEDHEGVRLAASNLERDLAEIASQEGDETEYRAGRFAIIAGSLDRSPTIARLAREGKIDPSAIEGQWEAYTQSVVDRPLPGIERALVIAGSDQRGTIYGIYDLAERAGMSPWHYWADVPAERHDSIHVAPGARSDAPGVRYRGIFLNDENPALYGFAHETFGGFNAVFYETVFDLILRLKGNYLWPAMWGKAFYDDDPANGALAERMGIVMGTSHHEPLTRAHVEWARHGEGDWNYETNAEELRAFWRGGMERLGDGEALVTIGMRGDGDEAMSEETAISLLERIVHDQREIIADVTGEPAEATPQVWALYKEVQDYYDQGMEVPEDVTLLFADDNWGNIRRLPGTEEKRPGGYGVYYHFDYVGGPRNYKWLGTTQIERTWEQISMAWDRGVDRLWIVNVGDLKPMELPISFFLDQAWAPEDMTRERMDRYAEDWAEEIFGPEHAPEIGALLEASTRFNARRKPELLDAETFDAESGEWDRAAEAYRRLAQEADELRGEIAEPARDAYDQLVWFPIHAMSNLYDLYRAVAVNHLHADQGRPSANAWADAAEAAFARDAELTRIYHEDIADGKWDHMMSQTHIGYTYWQQPDEQAMPGVRRIAVPDDSMLRIALAGSEASRPLGPSDLRLPPLHSLGRRETGLTLFATGRQERAFSVETSVPWLSVTPASGTVGEENLRVLADWDAIPEGEHEASLAISSPGADETTEVRVRVTKGASAPDGTTPFAGHALAIDATDLACRSVPEGMAWAEVPNLGRRGDALVLEPGDGESMERSEAPSLTHPLFLTSDGEFTARVVLSPSFDVDDSGGLRYAIAVGDEEPQVVSFDLEPDTEQWNRAVSSYALELETRHEAKAGRQELRIWALSPSLVFQEVQLFAGEAPRSYLGPDIAAPLGSASCGASAP